MKALAENEKSSFLVLILDIASLVSEEDHPSKMAPVLDGISLFCNSFTAMHRSNELALLLSSGSKTATCAQEIERLKQRIPAAAGVEEPRSLSRCLSSAMCMVNSKKHLPVQHKVLILQFDKDVPLNYNGVMNSIFSAQKLGVYIDALVMSPYDSHLMQQACFLTTGLYMRHTELDDLQRLLQIHFLSDKATRTHLVMPLMKSVDFKSACRCHKKLVQFAYMCSVCLALFCNVTDVCQSCETPVQG